MELSIKNMAGQETGKKVVLNDAIFAIEPNDHAIYLDVKQFLANNRQGTAKAKQRSENAHSTRKLGRQKGGGGARPGDLKSPVRVGGGTIFGPVPRDYSFKLNKKVKQLARRSALSLRAGQNQIIVLDELKFDAPKTKAMVEVMKNLNIEGQKVLFVLPETNQEVIKSTRNIQRTNVMIARELNTYAIMNANMVVMVEGAVKAIEETLNVKEA
ncbi:MAG: 50S ribosomal protein L4 [Paludibacteraceae bacterium]|nr:50S ribosomal protein L4 [Paludibacteraceae bacterium]